ncbi:hypothetical protein BU604_10405, partial [Staphylococcus arlettae]|uniref:hypothetical protein n=1 Tax=Staphylococcus arlettae TaxID=29378 RepID=UPI000FF58F03
FFVLAVADCIENALQTKLFSTLVILAGVGRRNHFSKWDFCPTSCFSRNLFFVLAVADCIENALQTELVSTLVILAGVGKRNHFFQNQISVPLHVLVETFFSCWQ